MAKPAYHSPRRSSAKSSVDDIDQYNPRSNLSIFDIEKRRSWGLISVAVVNRAAGQAICRADCHRITYFLTDFHATMQDDDRPVWECKLPIGSFVYRPPGTTLVSNLTAGKYIQVLQSRDSYDNIISDMVRGAIVHLEPRYAVTDPIVSRLVLAIADEMEGGFLDRILVNALNTALAVQITRHFVDPSALALTPSNGLSRERLNRVQDYIEAHLDDRLSLTELAEVACLSPYHFSRSFKRAIGVGPQKFVMQRRLERAKTLLQRTNRPLAWIAQDAGFVDQSHLTCVFRRETGVTPRQFRVALA